MDVITTWNIINCEIIFQKAKITKLICFTSFRYFWRIKFANYAVKLYKNNKYNFMTFTTINTYKL